ncbi:hypothetical protein C8T65DRAFT_58239 [Cerioporus squamosus]|nr:hypothetical protein C8T65DRAFT_58239 [Cerioporus squamosus]
MCWEKVSLNDDLHYRRPREEVSKQSSRSRKSLDLLARVLRYSGCINEHGPGYHSAERCPGGCGSCPSSRPWHDLLALVDPCAVLSLILVPILRIPEPRSDSLPSTCVEPHSSLCDTASRRPSAHQWRSVFALASNYVACRSQRVHRSPGLDRTRLSLATREDGEKGAPAQSIPSSARMQRRLWQRGHRTWSRSPLMSARRARYRERWHHKYHFKVDPKQHRRD